MLFVFFLKYIYVLRFQPCIYSTVEQNSIPLCYGTAKCGHSDIALVKWSRWKCQRCGKLIFLRHQTFVYSPYKLHYHNYYFQIYLDVTTHHSNTVSCLYITKYSWLNLLVFFLLVAQYIFPFQYQRVPSYYRENPTEIQAIANETSASSSNQMSENQEKAQGGGDQPTESTDTAQKEATEDQENTEKNSVSEQAPNQSESTENPVTSTS